MTDPKKPNDWVGIENDYVNGDWSIRRIAEWYQISEAAIRKRAKASGWVRTADRAPRRKPVEGVETPVIMAGVDATKPENIVSRGQNLVFTMLAELEAASQNAPLLARLVEIHEDDPRSQKAMLQAVSLKGRSEVVKALATAFKTWGEAREAAPEGKKAQRQAAAQEIASEGKFAPRRGPRLAVDNG